MRDAAPGLLSAPLGLASAAMWGAGDFSGGLVTRRSNVYGVVAVSQAAGLLLLAALALLLAEPWPAAWVVAWAAAAGVAGTGGLVALYSGLSAGPMGVVAPVAAVATAVLPVLFGALFEGLPSVPDLGGFFLAFVAVWLVSRTGNGRVRLRDIGLPLAAGVGFGLFLILLGGTSDVAPFWPLVVARIVSMSAPGVWMLARRERLPERMLLPLILLTGVFDTGGNVFYALATRAGCLDAAAVLGSLYPATTVLLARLVLKEPLSARQGLGLFAVVGAVALIAV